MAFTVMSSSFVSPAWVALLTACMLPFVFAPQPMRKIDRRVIALVVAGALAGGLEFVSKICDWCPWCIECWFL